MHRKSIPYLIVGIFLVTAWIAYGGLPDQPWSYDDEPHVEKAAAVAQSPGVLLDGNSKEPLRFLSHLYFLLIYALTDASPGAYHLCNVLLHLMNCGILIYVAKRWIGLPAAAVAGFLFLLNTAGYEAIYSIAASATLLGTAFALLAVDRTAAYLESPSRSGVLAAGGCYLACLMSYESHISALLPLSALAIAVHRMDKIARQLIITLIGAIAVVALIDLLAFQTSDDKVAFNQLGLGFHALGNFGFFFARLLLCAFVTPGKWGDPFPYDISPDDWSTYSWLGWVLFAGCAALSIRDKRVLGTTVWMSATILPYLFSTDHMYFTRYWYLPAAGASVLFAIAMLEVTARARSAQPIAVVVLLATVGYFAISKAHAFEGRYLFHAANYYLAHRKEPEIARNYYLRVIDAYGYDGGLAYSQLGVSQTRSGRADEAMVSFELATKRGPNLDTAFRNLGTLRWKAGDSEGAVESFERAITLDQNHTSLLPELGSELIRLEKWELAIRVWEAAVQYWPEQSEPLGYLGVSLYNAGRQTEAREKLEAALLIDSRNTVALLGLGISHELAGNPEKAIQFYERGLAVEPDDQQFIDRLSSLTQNSR